MQLNRWDVTFAQHMAWQTLETAVTLTARCSCCFVCALGRRLSIRPESLWMFLLSPRRAYFRGGTVVASCSSTVELQCWSCFDDSTRHRTANRGYSSLLGRIWRNQLYISLERDIR
ncbi:Hypothetical protein, putative [Bodo saltans]|uniref:Uncharacterized protein n=1 Tax=Bodo saltans TaxID=75058 RepID=A0A0S4J0A1_BODSA|nr:Hypothetical protein, putative [Bodo saltans]|eukprot:CUG42819.1 Hypothetical protein, putative [Bodo saltans]